MNKKKLLPLCVLAGVVVVLAVILALLSIFGGEEDEDTGIALFSVTADDLSTIAYQDGDTDVALTKGEDGVWTLDSDTMLPIDQDAVSELATSITGMTAQRELGEDADVDSMGFATPEMSISFTAGEDSYTLTVGDQNSMTDTYYARLGEDGPVYTIATSDLSSLCKTPRQLYQAQDITDIESSDVTAMTLETGSEVLSFTLEDETWTLDSDPGYELDQDTVKRMVNTICSLESEWSITQPGPDSEYGLDTPNAVVTVTASDGSSVRCVFGTTSTEDSGVAYMTASTAEGVVYEIDSNHLTAFAYTKDTLKAETPETAEDASGDSE
ncbi:DUF4340 domain-containing protein [uncultured Gemmiger sp.]|uniref:DUF4340 domain-containing protein n=1 Tax=uncultured Gemmiger sp. TaxID=1623490 RepID=UPI0025F53CCD|nr:DUF4340 domain-containing protein [uncultured Gemmiger sp.]